MRICWHLFAADKHHCGSWLASDGGGSGNINCGCASLIAGKPAPTGFQVVAEYSVTPGTVWEPACWRRQSVNQ
ncbi:hypothetical protein CP335_11780 [Pseudomonas fluorescens]|uniref:Uncharacterized protein n=1 Tax=Pseudomonas fluorescens TaxID=294 RepID=A0A854XEN2_PSEFL|nr:hypothetical protein CP335_11780 [Pseudomonas fluorescens]